MFGHRVDANILLYIILLVDMIEYGRLCVDVLRLETRGELTLEWIKKTETFLDRAFAKVKGGSCTWCPCTKCGNTRRQTREDMTQHICNYGFTRYYTRWTYHGEANRMRDEVVRQCIEDHDADAG